MDLARIAAAVETLSLRLDRAVLVVELARPGAANALNTRMAEDLLRLWEAVDRSEELRAVVLTGQGRIFCAGADLKERRGMSDETWRAQHLIFERMIRAHLACPRPVIAAVNGAAYGGGCEFVLACDFAYAAPEARFALPETKLGFMPGIGGSQLLPRAIGQARTLEVMLSGEPLDARTACEWGLVNRVVPAEALMAETLRIAQAIANNAPLAVQEIRKAVRGGAALPLDEAMELELRHYNLLAESEDRREGVEAFNAKRPPVFKGR